MWDSITELSVDPKIHIDLIDRMFKGMKNLKTLNCTTFDDKTSQRDLITLIATNDVPIQGLYMTIFAGYSDNKIVKNYCKVFENLQVLKLLFQTRSLPTEAMAVPFRHLTKLTELRTVSAPYRLYDLIPLKKIETFQPFDIGFIDTYRFLTELTNLKKLIIVLHLIPPKYTFPSTVEKIAFDLWTVTRLNFKAYLTT